jgi:NADPH:quinone reductase-like Zn-dependent oxidoreductase
MQIQQKDNLFIKPQTMKAAQGKDYGDIDEMLAVEDSVAYPSLVELFPKEKQRNKHMIVRTHAVSLACGDCRVLSGQTRELQGPPSFPYIPCADCSGVVVEIPEGVDETTCPFQVGDRVTARFVGTNRGALAEYAVVHQSVCEKVPEEVSSVDAAALAGACPATLLGERIRQGERVLILGAGGGIGSLTCQIMRHQGASYIAGASQQSPERLLKAPMSYNKIVDYTKEDPFAVKEFQDNPFDVVVDLAGVGGWMSLVKSSQNRIPAIVKPASAGGRYLTLTPDTAIYEIHSIPQAIKLFMFIPIWRALKSRLWSRSKLPKYTFAMSLDEERSHLTRTLEMARKGTIKAVVDGPFPFTTEGIRKAFRIQESRHGQGKVIVQVSKSDS